MHNFTFFQRIFCWTILPTNTSALNPLFFARDNPLVLLGLLLGFLMGSPTGAESKPANLLLSVNASGFTTDIAPFYGALARELGELQTLQLISNSATQEFLQRERLQESSRGKSDDQLLIAKFAPDLHLQLNLEAPAKTAGRYKWVPTLGQQKWWVQTTMNLRQLGEERALFSGVLRADSAKITGWCGLLKCVIVPSSALEQAAIYSQLLANLAGEIARVLEARYEIPRQQKARTQPTAPATELDTANAPINSEETPTINPN